MNSTKITKEQSKDTGIVFGLMLLFTGIVTGSDIWLKASIVLIIAALVLPSIFRYPAAAWFFLSEKLGFVVSRIILALVYGIVVLPVSGVRKIFGRDPMMIRYRRKEYKSLWIVREHRYSENDFIKPF